MTIEMHGFYISHGSDSLRLCQTNDKGTRPVRVLSAAKSTRTLNGSDRNNNLKASPPISRWSLTVGVLLKFHTFIGIMLNVNRAYRILAA